MSKSKIKTFIFFCMIILVSLFNYLFFNSKWTDDTVYGNWKITRLVGAEGGTKGESSYGCNIGRSILITESNVWDSNNLVENKIDTLQSKNYSMKIVEIAEVVNDVSKREDLGEFQTKNSIVLEYAGITDDIIYQYDFYSKEQEDMKIQFSEFSVYSYDYENHDKLLMWLEPGGYYLLERFKEQEKTKEIYGVWIVEYMVSRGEGTLEELDYFNKYGQCFELDKSFVRKNAGIATNVVWEKECVNKDDFEKKYQIYEGLGIENKEIEIWFGKNKKETFIIIPVSDNEIISLIDGQWFLLKKHKVSGQKISNLESILKGTWKINQLLALGNVNEKLEIESAQGNTDYISWWYSQAIIMDHSRYAAGAITEDWRIERYDKREFQKKYPVPENIMCILKNNESITVATREIYNIREVFVILDEKTMIRERNGLWYKLEKVEK